MFEINQTEQQIIRLFRETKSYYGFGFPLYIVGGWVSNKLYKLNNTSNKMTLLVDAIPKSFIGYINQYYNMTQHKTLNVNNNKFEIFDYTIKVIREFTTFVNINIIYYSVMDNTVIYDDNISFVKPVSNSDVNLLKSIDLISKSNILIICPESIKKVKSIEINKTTIKYFLKIIQSRKGIELLIDNGILSLMFAKFNLDIDYVIKLINHAKIYYNEFEHKHIQLINLSLMLVSLWDLNEITRIGHLLGLPSNMVSNIRTIISVAYKFMDLNDYNRKNVGLLIREAKHLYLESIIVSSSITNKSNKSLLTFIYKNNLIDVINLKPLMTPSELMVLYDRPNGKWLIDVIHDMIVLQIVNVGLTKENYIKLVNEFNKI